MFHFSIKPQTGPVGRLFNPRAVKSTKVLKLSDSESNVFVFLTHKFKFKTVHSSGPGILGTGYGTAPPTCIGYRLIEVRFKSRSIRSA